MPRMDALGLTGKHDFQADLDAVAGISAVPRILDLVCRTTGMGFAAVARVTPERWIACSVQDNVAFGLRSGDELKVETTLCHEIRQSRQPVVFDNAPEDPRYAAHHTPAIYGLKSYISVPIILPDGRFFGTLCAIDSRPARVNTPEVIGMFELYAELIAHHLDGHEHIMAAQNQLVEAQKAAELREHFIAVLGHDLRNPLGAITSGVALLERTPLNERGMALVAMMQKCTNRMTELIENVLDFAHGRLGGGITLDMRAAVDLEPVLHHVVSELRTTWQDRVIIETYDLRGPVTCDPDRIAQLFSNLLGNALNYGAPDLRVRVGAQSRAGEFELFVANGGRPIPESAMARLFQPFVRGGGGETQPQGLGLGLYIASEIARAHGGALQVVSNTSETRFTLKIPA
ncbi:MAG: GAF domain-containing sensor histidine kinase [Asticcacaulis sp.]|uniref:GAF domain-containing sensor histidine kinase n=1 Tax=Asticcacaulis sp. TaxID=1872648 RepID=UPI0039E2FB12